MAGPTPRSPRRDPNVRLPQDPPPPPKPSPIGKLGEIDDAFVAPIPPPIARPNIPKVPAPPVPQPPGAPAPPATPPAGPGPAPTPTGPSPADVLPRQQLPSSLPLPRQRMLPLPTAATVLGVLWELVFLPYFETPVRSIPTGPPRRTRPRSTVVDSPTAAPGRPGTWPQPRIPAPTGDPTDEWNPPLPTRPRTVPRTSTPVRTVPAPGWTLDDPLDFPGYDPFTHAPPTPQPRAPARPFPRTTGPDFPFPIGWPVDLPVRVPRGVPSGRPGPLSPIGDPLTGQPSRPRGARPVKLPSPLDPVLDPLAEPRRPPTEANPCTSQRTERRRRQKKCKEFTTKTIRVCADK